MYRPLREEENMAAFVSKRNGLSSQIGDARIAGSLQLLSQEFEVLPWSSQLLQFLHSTNCGFVQFTKALFEACDGWMGQTIEDGEKCAEIV